MLRDLGVQYAIVGHSERRHYFKEGDDLLERKIHALLDEGMRPIVCCGESLSVRRSGQHNGFVCQQLKAILGNLRLNQWARIVVAYEPIWAIGTGKSATTQDIQAMHTTIRDFIAQMTSLDVAESVPILYGGSVGAKNAASIFACQDVDGGLVGGQSLDAGAFFGIIQACVH